MPRKPELERYLLEIIVRARTAREQCGVLLESTYMSEPPRQLARAIASISDYLEKVAIALVDQSSAGDSEEASKDTLALLQCVDVVLMMIYAHLRYVEGARPERLPWSTVAAFEKLVSKVLPNISVMLRPQWNYNYSFHLSDLRAVYRQMLDEFQDFVPATNLDSSVLGDLDRPFHIIGFPALERTNILLHSLLGHELGHLLAHRFLDADRQTAFVKSVMADLNTLAEEELMELTRFRGHPGRGVYGCPHGQAEAAGVHW
jgi:hypothetical protein